MSTDTNLIPGSMWTRATKRGNEETTDIVFCVSNLSASAKMQERMPPQVVFLTEKGSLFTVPVDTFMKSRTYAGISEAMADLHDIVVTFHEEDEEEDEIILESDTKLEDQFRDLVVPEISSSNEDDSEAEAEDPPIFYAGDHPVAQQLQAAFISYHDQPYLDTVDTEVVLTFAPDEGITKDMLVEAFNPRNPEVIGNFVINAGAGLKIDYAGNADNALIGVYQILLGNELGFQVHLLISSIPEVNTEDTTKPPAEVTAEAPGESTEQVASTLTVV